MAQIFISHSKRDKDIVRYFGTLCATTRVKCILKEIEGFKSQPPWQEIQNDMQQSAAIFILLGPNMQKFHHTRDWVVWESAIASLAGKEIWVFEPYEYLREIDVSIPHTDHYMIYKRDDEYQNYIRSIVESYDDSDVLPAAIAGGLVGGLSAFVVDAVINEGRIPPPLSPIHIAGAIIGGAASATAADPSKNRSQGIQIKCPECENIYQIHMKIPEMRCPICNMQLEMDWNTYERERGLMD